MNDIPCSVSIDEMNHDLEFRMSLKNEEDLTSQDKAIHNAANIVVNAGYGHKGSIELVVEALINSDNFNAIVSRICESSPSWSGESNSLKEAISMCEIISSIKDLIHSELLNCSDDSGDLLPSVKKLTEE